MNIIQIIQKLEQEKLTLVASQHLEHTAAHGAQAHDAYLYRFHKFFR